MKLLFQSTVFSECFRPALMFPLAPHVRVGRYCFNSAITRGATVWTSNAAFSFLTVDIKRGRPFDSGFFALMLFRTHAGGVFVAVEFGSEAVHIHAGFLRPN